MITILTDNEIKGSKSIHECKKGEEKESVITNISVDKGNELYLEAGKNINKLVSKVPNIKNVCYIKGEPFIRYTTSKLDRKGSDNSDNNSNNIVYNENISMYNKLNTNNNNNNKNTKNESQIETKKETHVKDLLGHMNILITLIKKNHHLMKQEIMYRLKLIKFKRDNPSMYEEYKSLIQFIIELNKIRYTMKMMYSIDEFKQFLDEKEDKIYKRVNKLEDNEINIIYKNIMESLNQLTYYFNSETHSITTKYVDIGYSKNNESLSIIERVYDIMNQLNVTLSSQDTKQIVFKLKTKKNIYRIQNMLYGNVKTGIKHTKVKRKIIKQFKKRMDETLNIL